MYAGAYVAHAAVSAATGFCWSVSADSGADYAALAAELDANGVPAEMRDRYVAAFRAMDLRELVAATAAIIELAQKQAASVIRPNIG
jgi:hypothetical protein